MNILDPFLPQIFSRTNQNNFIIGIEKFAGEHIPALTPIRLSELRSLHQKEIADPILGNILLNSWEVALLDTLLFQRLRGISQLGLAYHVYPALRHSRFEHTLGVIGRVDQILTQLRLRNERNPDPILGLNDIIQRFEIPLRLAALFHDAGHCIFSHVSERIINELRGSSSYPSAESLQLSAKDFFGKSKAIPIAEILSISLLLSNTTREFISHLDIPKKTDLQLAEWLFQAAHFIAGVPVRDKPETLFLAQIMSSGLDADKMDYMTREAHYAGISLGIDFRRLFAKLQVFSLPSRDLPAAYQYLKETFDIDTRFMVLGLLKGGQFAFEEFCLARVSLYDKIYLHHKVRSSEAQLANRLNRFAFSCSDFQEVHRWLYLKESYAECGEEPIPSLNNLGPLFSPQKVELLKLTYIPERHLVHRSYGFGLRNSLSDPPLGALKKGQITPTLRLFEELERNSSDLILAIRYEYDLLANRLGRQPLPDDSNCDLVVDIPSYRRVQQGLDTFHFARAPQTPVMWTFPIDQIVEYYMRYRAIAFIFTHREYSPLVYLASERVLLKLYNLQFVQEDALKTDLIIKAQEIKKECDKLGLYDSYLPIRPTSKYLSSGEAYEKMNTVANALKSFTSYKKEHVTLATIKVFLTQFPQELQPPALGLISLLRVIEPKAIVDGVVHYYLKIAELKKTARISIVPLGNLTDSSTHCAFYFKNHENNNFRSRVQDVNVLDSRVVSNSECILFFDDNTNSGLQTLNIMAEWLGVALQQSVNLGENHVSPLASEAQKILRSLELHFVFGIGPEDSEFRIQSLLSTHLGIPTNSVHVHLIEVLKSEEKTFSGKNSPFEHEKKRTLRDFLENKGYELMKAEGKSDEVAHARALGDAGAEALVAFPYNVPTMTILPLWCAGANWHPLIERRRSRSNSGALIGEDA